MKIIGTVGTDNNELTVGSSNAIVRGGVNRCVIVDKDDALVSILTVTEARALRDLLDSFVTSEFLEPALSFLDERRRSSGYATLDELCAVYGFDSTDEPYRAQKLAETLAQHARIAVENPIGIGDSTKYRLID